MTTTTKSSAFNGDPKLKQFYLDRVRRHREADQLVQGYGYWVDGKGCAVGCLAHVNSGPHAALAEAWNADERLFYLADAIFEGLPVDLAKAWPERFTAAFPVGADCSLVWNRFALWLLTDSGVLAIDDGNRASIEGVAELHRKAIEGVVVSPEDWSAAARSARSAKSAAAAAAESAARSAESAARSAAWSAAAAAAESAARSAKSAAAAAAARSASFEKMADKLVELIAASRS